MSDPGTAATTTAAAPENETIDHIRALVLEVDQVAAWPLMQDLVLRRIRAQSKPCWDYGFHAAESLGVDTEEIFHAAASVFCLMISINLIDDVLDEDPRGLYRQIGPGAAANVAAAFQAVAGLILDRAGWSPETTAAAHAALARAALATAWGQHLDAQDPPADEDAYWRIVRAKTPPLFSASFELGALAAGAAPGLARDVAGLGKPLGELVQVSDDLHDALQTPAAPDWKRRGTNLPILYARLAEHDERERFVELAGRVQEPAALEEAQRLLVTSGALSYCAFNMIRVHRDARERIDALELQDPAPLTGLFAWHMEPLKNLLERCGVEDAETLIAGEA